MSIIPVPAGALGAFLTAFSMLSFIVSSAPALVLSALLWIIGAMGAKRTVCAGRATARRSRTLALHREHAIFEGLRCFLPGLTVPNV